MKKTIVSLSAAVTMIVCCLFGFNAFAQEPAAAQPKSDIKYATVTVTSTTKVGAQPVFTVKFGTQVLSNGKDFTYKVANNNFANYNKGRIYLSGKNSFYGTKTVKFSVYPSKVIGVKASNIKQNSLYLTWNSKSNEGISGYKIYKASNKNGKDLKLLKTVSANSASLSNLGSSTKYYIFVAAYKTNNKKTVVGDLSNAYIFSTKPDRAKLNYAIKKGKNKIYVNWNRVSNAGGYEIRYSLDKKMKKGVKTVRVKGSKSSKSIKVKDNGYAYYVRVRAYKNYSKNGKRKTVYGPWSVKMSSIFGRVYKQYTTNYPYNPNRTTNLKLACKAIDGTIVNPGATFSFNKTVGERTAAKGYKPAVVFLGPNDNAKEPGGGVCQVASTMYNAALLSNLQITERHQHSQKITYCPLGRDAAIYWSSVDFKFTNNTNYPIKIRMSCKDGKLTCTYMVSYKIKAPKVSLNVSKNGNNYKLTRSVKGKVNYTAYSTY